MSTNEGVHSRIGELVAEERELRERLQRGELSVEEEHARLGELEVQLDQCWDLLRQRDALRSAGQDPDEARVRPPEVVERYIG